jgi:AcrR family transcriptional regulator
MDTAEKKRGRPRSFSADDALDSALEVFLKKGYEGCSVDDLACALGINKPSLYSAFGNKEELFVSVLRRYHGRYREKFGDLTARGLTPKETIEVWFSWFLDNYRSQDEPLGCLIVNSTLLAGEKYPKIAEELKAFHDLNEELMADYLRKQKRNGTFSGDPTATSQFLNAVVQGMAVLHRGQRNASALKNIARQALEAFSV